MADGQENVEEISAPTAEELKQEDEALQETPAEKVRASLVEKYNLEDNDANKAFIDQLTADTLESRKSFGKAISQKRSWRDKASKAAKPNEPANQPAPQQQPAAQPDVNAIVNERLEQRDLDDMDLPEDIKKEVQRLAKALSVPVRQAAKDPYILHKVEEYKREQKALDAAPRTNGKGASVKFDKNNPPKPDMSTPEGRKEWDEYQQWLLTQSE